MQTENVPIQTLNPFLLSAAFLYNVYPFSYYTQSDNIMYNAANFKGSSLLVKQCRVELVKNIWVTPSETKLNFSNILLLCNRNERNGNAIQSELKLKSNFI